MSVFGDKLIRAAKQGHSIVSKEVDVGRRKGECLYTDFGKIIKLKLSNRFTTQEKFSRSIGVNPSHFNSTLTGVRPPKPWYVDKVADAFEMTDHERKKLHYLAAKANGFKLE